MSVNKLVMKGNYMKLQFRQINFLKPQNIKNTKTTNPIKYQYNLSSDTISFSGKSLVQQVKDLEKDAFLSDGLREYILSYIDDKNNLIDLHKEYYASLLNCKTLDEAKELYPEFRDVVDLKDVDLSSISFYAPKQIAKGQIEGLNKENASLVFLKKYIGELTPLKSGCNEDYFYLSYQTIKKMFKFLNISMNDDYESLITKNRKSKAAKARWQDKEFREKTLKSLNSPETKAKHATNSSEKRIKVIQENIKIIATKLAFNQSPETQQIYQETLETDSRFKDIISKTKLGLTYNKIRYVNMCLEEMSQKYPEEIQKVKEIQSQILSDWGFYDEDTNFEKLVEQAQKLDPDNKNNRK